MGPFFLNRVGDLTLDAQGRLLRAIQDREIWTIHDSLHPGSHLRILAATTRDLKLAVEEAGRVAYRDSFAKDLNSELSNCNSTLVMASVVTLGHVRRG